MTFLWPDMLWLLLLLPLLVGTYVWLLRRRKKTALRYANLPLIRQALGKGPGWRRHVPPALLLLAVGVLVLAVARPAAVVTLPSSRSTVILAIDTSGSMRATDMSPSRIAAAQEAAKAFITSQPMDVEIGIVAFAASAVLMQAPTLDRELLTAAVDGFDLRRGTAVGAGVITALSTIFPDRSFEIEGYDPRDQLGMRSGGVTPQTGRSLDNAEPEPQPAEHVPVEPGSYQNAVIILLTDGATTTGPDPLAAGKLAADHGVRIYTVGFGSTGGEVVDFGGRFMRAMLDAPTLQAIAATTEGEYFEAQSAEALSEVYGTLATRLIEEKKLTEIAFLFAGLGALLTLAAAGLSMLWLGRIA
ncbi:MULTISPECIES: VWA domain-containing protein [unclassified Devosia]|uniref:VWA domain-containing protein n=1 Tax=unclassified Devosia TaxID=196773 RepID=UPI001552E960|nr:MULTISPECIES: VWA domain-containing protein [unclassified Devosia]